MRHKRLQHGYFALVSPPAHAQLFNKIYFALADEVDRPNFSVATRSQRQHIRGCCYNKSYQLTEHPYLVGRLLFLSLSLFDSLCAALFFQGHFEFLLCDTDSSEDPGGVPLQSCFNEYPLDRAEDDSYNSPVDPDHRGRYYADPPCR